MNLVWPAMIGVFLGFVFGVGCALAVLYSIYTGGYRAAIADSRMATPPERYRKAIGREDRGKRDDPRKRSGPSTNDDLIERDPRVDRDNL